MKAARRSPKGLNNENVSTVFSVCDSFLGRLSSYTSCGWRSRWLSSVAPVRPREFLRWKPIDRPAILRCRFSTVMRLARRMSGIRRSTPSMRSTVLWTNEMCMRKLAASSSVPHEGVPVFCRSPNIRWTLLLTWACSGAWLFSFSEVLARNACNILIGNPLRRLSRLS